MAVLNRKQKAEIYQQKYGTIPVDYRDRMRYLLDLYNINEKQAQDILHKRDQILKNLEFVHLKTVCLFEEPEGAKRPRYRVTHRNFVAAAINDPVFVHVYSPNAAEDHRYMERLTKNELSYLNSSGIIFTPVVLKYDLFLKTPTSFTKDETILAEAGYIRPPIDKPDWDNGGKKYCDMYNETVFADDSQVISGTVNKYYSILPRVEINMAYLNAMYTKKQAKRVVERKNYDQSPLLYLDSKGDIQQWY